MLSGDQIAQFHRDGLLAVRGVFGEQEVRSLQGAADDVTEEAVAGAGTGHGYREIDGRKQYYRTDGVLWERHAAFRIATVNPGLLAAVGQCLGYPFMPINDSLVVKLPHSGVAIRWHQDPPVRGAGRTRRDLRDPQLRLRHLSRHRHRRQRLSLRPGRLSPRGSRGGGTLRR